MKKTFLFFAVLIILCQGCSYAIRYDGTYKGKVVDADTGVPIEGAVVLGTWYTVIPTVAGGVSTYYDARETATNKNGEFSIPGMGLRIMSNLEPMHFLIFKSGYEHIGSMPWISLKVDEPLSKRIKWEGNKPIIPLRKLTYKERKKSPADKETIPDDKQRLLIHEVNREYKDLGISLYPEEGVK